MPRSEADGLVLFQEMAPGSTGRCSGVRLAGIRRVAADVPRCSAAGPDDRDAALLERLHPGLARRLARSEPGVVRAVLSLRGGPRASRGVESAIGRVGGTVLERFRLVEALVAELPLAGLPAVLRGGGDRISYIEPTLSRAPPPRARGAGRSRATPGRARSAGWVRERMGTDLYRGLGLSEGRIALLDTDLFAGHDLLAGTGRVRRLRAARGGFAPAVPESPGGRDHGTASAAILTGGAALGEEHAGVTEIPVDCYPVYDSSRGVTQLDLAAAVRGVQTAVEEGASVIVAQIQNASPPAGVLDRAADEAYRAGAVVVAACGNEPGGLPAPAAAAGCLAVGGVDARTLAPVGRSRGPTGGGRVKPELATFTGSHTACARRPDALAPFDGTSGATPYAAGAAALIRNWIGRVERRFDPNAAVEPGAVYALLLLSSVGARPTAGPDATGAPEPAGLLRLPSSGSILWGRATVEPGEAVALTLSVRDRAERLEAAIWYPRLPAGREVAAGLPGAMSLRVLRAGAERGRGAASGSEAAVDGPGRVGVTGDVGPGAWTLRLERAGREGRRSVYLAARVT